MPASANSAFVFRNPKTIKEKQGNMVISQDRGCNGDNPTSGIQNPKQNVEHEREPFSHLKEETSYLPMISLSFATRGYFCVLITFNTNNCRNP